MSYQFTLTTPMGVAPEQAFELAADLGAHASSMQHSREEVVTGYPSGAIGVGESVTFRAKHFGVWWKMTSTITAVERPHRFVDEQTCGPFARFHHEHRFVADGDRSTMIDTITFEAPFGALGRVVEKMALGPYMRRLIAQRNQYLSEQTPLPPLQ